MIAQIKDLVGKVGVVLVLWKKQLEFDGHNWSSVTTCQKDKGDMKYAM